MILVLFALWFPFCVSFPLSALTLKSFQIGHPQRVHSYSGTDVVLTAMLSDPPNKELIPPNTEFPKKPWSVKPWLVMRANPKSQDVLWTQVLTGVSGVGTCLDENENLFSLGIENKSTGSIVSIRKFLPNGTLASTSSFKHPISKNLYISSSYIACPNKDTIVFQAEANKTFYFVVVNGVTGKVGSVMPLQPNGSYVYPSYHLSSANGTTCTFLREFPSRSLRYRKTSTKWSIHCVHTMSGTRVLQRPLARVRYFKNGFGHALLLVAPKERWAKCQPMYVVYPSNEGVLPAKEPVPRQLILRKLCVDSLKDTPWSQRGQPHIRYIALEDATKGLAVDYLRPVSKHGGFAALCRAPLYDSTGNISNTGRNTTLLGTTNSDIINAPESWLFVYGQAKRPYVLPAPIKNDRTKGYSLPTGYNNFYYSDMDVSKNNRHVIVFGSLSFWTTMPKRNKFYTYKIPLPR